MRIKEAGINRIPAGLDNIAFNFSLNINDAGERKKINNGMAISEYTNKYRMNQR